MYQPIWRILFFIFIFKPRPSIGKINHMKFVKLTPYVLSFFGVVVVVTVVGQQSLLWYWHAIFEVFIQMRIWPRHDYGKICCVTSSLLKSFVFDLVICSENRQFVWIASNNNKYLKATNNFYCIALNFTPLLPKKKTT